MGVLACAFHHLQLVAVVGVGAARGHDGAGPLAAQEGQDFDLGLAPVSGKITWE